MEDVRGADASSVDERTAAWLHRARVLSRRRARPAQPAAIRVAHWLNVPLLALMAGSGLQILVAFPYLGPRGALYRFYPLQGWRPPAWLCAGGWLAGGRAMHFALAWFFVGNAMVYLFYLFGSGEWRLRLFWPPRDLKSAFVTASHYVRFRNPPESGLYNGLQRLAYTTALILGAVAVLSGLAIYKPLQLSTLAAGFGGYDGARLVHLLSLAALAFFALGHLLMVVLHPRALRSMIDGGPRDGIGKDHPT